LFYDDAEQIVQQRDVKTWRYTNQFDVLETRETGSNSLPKPLPNMPGSNSNTVMTSP